MKQIRMLSQCYIDLMMKLESGPLFDAVALALVVLAIVVNGAMVLHGQVQ
ncbi:hypothetical protein MJ579_25700 [Klebsiella pneumoniae]|nr:hypothetical protein MJ579_25700 [Klebsiella pneumoniae]